MEQAQQFVCAVHPANKGVPSGLLRATAQADEGVDGDEGREGRVEARYHVREQLAGTGYDDDAPLAGIDVDGVVT